MINQGKTPPPGVETTIETTTVFLPKFGPDGLIYAIVTDQASGDVLMFAHMNEAALRETLSSGIAHFWSRSRARLWKKGEESGNLLKVSEIRTDCDQDVIWLSATVEGAGVACHTGAKSCFYRKLTGHPGQPGGVRLMNAATRDPHAKP
jgi:phosphoribosyl-AMP cyclohydrolase